MSAAPGKKEVLFRLLLLALLPLIALGLYMEGQNYDEGLVSFTGEREKSTLLEPFFPEKRGELAKLGHPRYYDKKNLYEYINGHAELFISSGFKGLAVADYGDQKEEKGEVRLIVDIYDMGNPANAFGILMEESGEGSEVVAVGFQGRKTERTLNFIKGAYYVKINAFAPGEKLKDMARSVDENLGDLKTPLPQLERFPQRGKVEGALSFIKEDYRGIPFFQNIFEQKYDREGERFSVFLARGGGVKEKTLRFLEEEGIPYKKVEKGAYFEIDDPYEGRWYLLPGKGEVFGVMGAVSERGLEELRRELY